jgi:rhodanese-related sulfurtransferase
MAHDLKAISPRELKIRMDRGEAILIDIREADEYARAHIPGSRLAPMSSFDSTDFAADSGKEAVFHCRSGMRTDANAARLLAKGFRDAYCLTGGLSAWEAAGLPVRTNAKAPLELMRQVQIAAGSLILVGVVLGWLAHPGFYALSGFVGAGLLQAGVTGWCGMALLLKAVPWNRVAPAPVAA